MSEETFDRNSPGYWNDRFEKDWAEKSGPQYTHRYAELLFEHLPGWFTHEIRQSKMSICDWGCAEGEAVGYLGQVLPGQTIAGVDVAPAAIEHAKKKFPAHTFQAANWLEDAENLPRYDVVLTAHVLEHFRDPLGIVRNVLAKVAQKYVVLMVPYAENPARMDKEHQFRFLRENLPFYWPDWFCVFFKILDTTDYAGPCWHGQQVILIYSPVAYWQAKGEDAFLSGFPAETAILHDKISALEKQLSELEYKKQIVEKNLDIQRWHDQVLLRSNTSMKQQNEKLTLAYQQTLEKKELLEHRQELLRKDLDRIDDELRRLQGKFYVRWVKRINKERYRAKMMAARWMRALPISQTEEKAKPVLESKLAASSPPDISRVPAPREPVKSLKGICAGSILDTFSHSCFAPECRLTAFHPENWKEILRETAIDFLLVESAWKGNEGAWQFRIGTYKAPPGRELDDVLEWCRGRGIPAVFWNKEDPPNYGHFIEAARKFDYVFTTDANCIEKYKRDCGHDRIAALPFAAQPAIHNPVLRAPRDGQTCFAGTYYADCFDRRRADMEMLLRAGAEFGLDIFNRNFGYKGQDEARTMFPAEFHANIRGKLEYAGMLDAYRRYRVFLNVNSVYDSPTMFSRRVFELLACGTPVITTESLGIREFFGDLVPQVTSKEEAREALRGLLHDPKRWWRVSALGIRRVMSEHTYAHRLQAICEALGLKTQLESETRKVAVVVPQGSAENIIDAISAQTELMESVFVLGTDPAAAKFEQHCRENGIPAVALSPENLLRNIQVSHKDACVAFLSGRHRYGPNYFFDAGLALHYCGMPVTGLSTVFQCGEDGNLREQTPAGEEHYCRTACVRDTMVLRGEAFTETILQYFLQDDMEVISHPCYSRSRYEFVQNCAERRSDDVFKQAFL